MWFNSIHYLVCVDTSETVTINIDTIGSEISSGVIQTVEDLVDKGETEGAQVQVRGHVRCEEAFVEQAQGYH